MKPKKSHYIQDLILEGEHEHQDFKYQITDARKIARLEKGLKSLNLATLFSIIDGCILFF